MKPFDFALLADENIHPAVVAYLRQQSYDVQSVAEEGLKGQSDVALLRHAHKLQRVVLTHDSDFGTLAVLQGEPFTGIIYLRPGHIKAEFTIKTLQALTNRSPDVKSPFIVVAEQTKQSVRIRVRQL